MKHTANIRQLCLIGLFAAIICISAPFSIYLPLSPVPISLATFTIYFCSIVAGMKCGTISVAIYILLGLMGLPVFSGFTGGANRLMGPTGGYLLGYLFMALICGFFADKWIHKHLLLIPGMILGTGACYLLGTLWFSHQMSVSVSQALLTTVLPFLPVDFAKLSVAIIAGLQVRKRLKNQLNFFLRKR